MSNSFSLKKKKKETFLRNFPTNLLFSRLPPSSCMYCTTLKRYVFFERRIFHISGKEKRPSSYLQVEVKISRKRVVLRSKYVTRWKSREIGWGSRILSRARILKGPSEFLKTRVIDPLTYGAKKKKRKSILGLETRQDWVFSRKRRKEESTNSSIRSREYRSVVEFDERSCSTNREYPLLFSRYSFTRPFSPRNRYDISDAPTLQRLS